MYQNVLTNHTITKQDLEDKAYSKLIRIGNAVINQQRYGVSRKIDRYSFIKLKNLLPLITANVIIIDYNQLNSALND